MIRAKKIARAIHGVLVIFQTYHRFFVHATMKLLIASCEELLIQSLCADQFIEIECEFNI